MHLKVRNVPVSTRRGSLLSPIRVLLFLGVCALVALGYLSLGAAATLSKLPFLPNRALRTSTLNRRQGGAAAFEEGFSVEGPPPPSTAAPRKGFPEDAACHPLGGQLHAKDGSPLLFECSALHPTGCVPRSQYTERFWHPKPLDSPGYKVYELKNGYRMLAANLTGDPPFEAIAFHLKTANEPVCPADLVDELRRASEQGRHEVFIDAGSNIGSCAVVALRYGHSVMAFEPGAENAALWRTNVMLNRDLYPKTTKPGQPRQFALLLPLGLAEKVQQLTLLLDQGNSGNAMVLDLSAGDGKPGSSGKTLDEYFPGQKIAEVEAKGLIEHVCLVAIDWLHAALRKPSSSADGATPSEAEQEHWLGPVDPTFGTLPLSSIPKFFDAASIMKVDIQGHEFKLFKGAAKYIKGQIQSFERNKKGEQKGEPAFPKFPMLTPPAPAEEPRSPGQPPLPLGYGHFRQIFFELSMELVFRKGDDPFAVRAFLLERGFGISMSQNKLVSEARFKKVTDLGPNGHNHNPSANMDLVARRLDLLAKGED